MRTAIALLLVLGMGCVVEESDAQLSEESSELLAFNKLTSNKLTSNKLLAATLGGTPLSSASLMTSPMVDTPDRREVLSFIIGCALPAGETLSLTYGGTTYEFSGLIGLAPAWATRTPNHAERRWVTACVLARTNLYGVQVPISMRSKSNPTLAATIAEKNTFTTPEGAFYGDLFAPTPVMYACGTRAWTAPTAGTPRACTLSANGVTTDCGFTYTGLCHGASSPCLDRTPAFGGCTGGGFLYNEIITIGLAP